MKISTPAGPSATLLSLFLVPALACGPSSPEAAEDVPAVETALAAAPAPLAPTLEGRALEVVNRLAEPLEEEGVTGVRMSAAEGDGLAWVDGVTFSSGVIELRVRGRNLPGQSFVGVAFNGVDANTYEAVYLRPFNFRAETPAQRARAVQYIAHPAYTWNRLREEQPGVFEGAVGADAEPDGWVDLRLEVDSAQVRAYVGGDAEPKLVVERLGQGVGGRVGLWVGNGSAGDFASLRVSP